MTLLEKWLDITRAWEGVFPRRRTALRAVRQGLGALACVGRRTLTRIIWANGGEQRGWSAEYFLHSRVNWEPQRLFAPVLKGALPLCPGRLVGVAVDDTKLHKTGRRIKQAFYQRDPLSPPFHPNLSLGLRFLQASLLVPLHKRTAAGCRALPIRFEESPCVKRPAKRAGRTHLNLRNSGISLFGGGQAFFVRLFFSRSRRVRRMISSAYCSARERNRRYPSVASLSSSTSSSGT